MPAEPARFAALFNEPSIEAMYALSPKEFEHFVAYVLRRAGYDVKEVGPHWARGVDLEMRALGKTRIVGGVECKRYAPGSQFVTAPIVKGVRGAPAVGKAGAKPYVVTTSDFNDPAHIMSLAEGKRAYLINGLQLLRYITYIRGSRRDDDDIITPLPPEFFAGRDTQRSRVAGTTKILAIANNKGGVGKTTTAYYLGVQLALRNKRVLLIDLDGQGNLTERCIPIQVDNRSKQGGHFPNVAEYFSGDRALDTLVTSSETALGVSLIPSDPDLSLRDLGGSGRPGLELQFVHDVQKLCGQSLAGLAGPPDWIIIDTPPARSVFTRAALAVAQYVVAPVRPRSSSLAGTEHMLQTVKTMDALMGTEARFLGALITHWDDLVLSNEFVNTRLAPSVHNSGGRVFNSQVPIDNQLDTVLPTVRTNGAKKYDAWAEELLDEVEQPISSNPSTQRELASHVVTVREE